MTNSPLMTPVGTPSKPDVQYQPGWSANLVLQFAVKGDRTQISSKSFRGPLAVQKPFYPEGDTCHVYVLHPPGGVVGGDQLAIELKLQEHSHVLVTTPAANKFYRSDERQSRLRQRFELGQGAALEWLPQESIFFDQCNTRLDTRIDLALESRFITWDVICLGRPASSEPFQQGTIRQSLEIAQQGKVLLNDRLLIEGAGKMLTEPWGFNDYPVVGYLVAAPGTVFMRDKVREITGFEESARLTTTLINGLLVCRVLARQAELARKKLLQIWQILRPDIMAKEAIQPRIWHT
jgi:urease accessory protein